MLSCADRPGRLLQRPCRGLRPGRGGERVRARLRPACSRSTGRSGRRTRPRCCSRPMRPTTKSSTSGQDELRRGFAGVTVSSLLFFTVLLLPIVWWLLGRLKRSQNQREELLERAVDASIEERRRIAGTLHDGVVQELAATSFTVAGAAATGRDAGRRAAGRGPARGRRDAALQHRRPALPAGRHLPRQPAHRRPRGRARRSRRAAALARHRGDPGPGAGRRRPATRTSSAWSSGSPRSASTTCDGTPARAACGSPGVRRERKWCWTSWTTGGDSTPQTS